MNSMKLAADNGFHNIISIRNRPATKLVTLKDKLSFDIWQYLVLYILPTVLLTVVISNSMDLTIDIKVGSFLIV